MLRGCVSEGGNFLWPGVRAGYNVTIEAQGPSGEAVVMTTLSLQPRIFSISPLLADFESEAIISQAAPIMVASPVMVRTNKQSAAERAKSAAKRTSTQARLPLGGNTVSAQIERRGHELLRVGVEHGEPLQVLRYDAGEKYDAHYDFFNTSLYGGQVSITRILLSSQAQIDRSSLLPIMQDRVLGITEGGRNRFATLLWYLAEPESGGGETFFPRVGGLDRPKTFKCDHRPLTQGLKVAPRKGSATLL